METLLDTHAEKIAGNVVADLVINRNNDGTHVVQIYGWSSLSPGQGNTNQALAKLKEDYPGIITVHDVGLPGDKSYNYWRHQLAKGRIDLAYDDDGNDIEEDG